MKPESAAMREARALFEQEGLPFPPVPVEMQEQVEPIAKWVYGTRPGENYLYDLDRFVQEVLFGTPPEYVLFGHSGHGHNSWAMHYYLVRGQLGLFVQIAWGGAYATPETTANSVDLLARLFEGTQRLLAKLEQQGQNTTLRASRFPRLVVIASSYEGARWTWIDEALAWDDPRLPLNWQEGELASVLDDLNQRLAVVHEDQAEPAAGEPAAGITLADFLVIEDLEILSDVRDGLGNLTEVEEQQIVALLQAGSERQAIANLLMHPDLIVQEKRMELLLRYFMPAEPEQGDSTATYLMLAALMGLQANSDDENEAAHQQSFAPHLLHLLEHSNGTVRQHASVALGTLLDSSYAAAVAERLIEADPILRHNLVVGLIDLVEVDAAHALVAEQWERARSEEPQSSAAAHLEQLTGELALLRTQLESDPQEIWKSELSAPYLPYLPNLFEWENRQ